MEHDDLFEKTTGYAGEEEPMLRAPREYVDRAALPYGFWTAEDGRLVIFNRYYNPIYVVSPDGATVPVAGGWMTQNSRPGMRYFFCDATAPWFHKKNYKKVHEVWHRLNRAAVATGYSRGVGHPGLPAWLRERGQEP